MDANVIQLISSNAVQQRKQAELTEQTAQAMMKMYEEMKEIKHDVDEFKEEMDTFKQEFRDNNRLIPAEVSDLYQAVCHKSVDLVKQFGIEDEEEFKKEVGKMRQRIWRKHNRSFTVSKYIYLPRKHFEESLSYIQSMDLRDFI